MFERILCVVTAVSAVAYVAHQHVTVAHLRAQVAQIEEGLSESRGIVVRKFDQLEEDITENTADLADI